MCRVSVVQGDREIEKFVEYLAKHSSEPLQGWDRSGKPKKEKKDKKKKEEL